MNLPNFFGADPVSNTIAAFLSGKAKSTQITYLGVLKEFLSFLGSKNIKGLLTVTPLKASSYISFLKKQPGIKPRSDYPGQENGFVDIEFDPQKSSEDWYQSVGSIRKKIAALRKIYRVLLAHGLVRQNPFVSELVTVPRSGSQKRPTEMIQFDRVKDVIEVVSQGELPTSARDACILAFLFGLGLRRSELIKIIVSDIKKSPTGVDYVILKKTKSGKDYELPLNDFVKNYLTFWLKVRQDYGIKSPYLFPSAKGRAKRKFDTSRPVAALTVWRLFKSACIKAGLGSNYSPHSARATSITRLLAEGYDFRSVQAFSRHSSIAMVELYDKRRLTIEQNPALKLKF